MLQATRKLLSTCFLVVASFQMPESAFAADARQGRAMAERWCSSCHVVGPMQKSAPNDQAPPFASIALRPDFDEGRLALLLLSPHPNMPKLTLSRFEIADLAEYIRTLK
jgi:mono/diheme cytochrome c family protein